MKKKEFTYPSDDHKTPIHAIRWEPDGPAAGILQISHGMVEYIGRYGEFARYLCERGYVVTGNDHLGHGLSVTGDEMHGYFAKENGNRSVLRDIHKLREITQEMYPGVPYFLLGHSMGSFLARQYLCMNGKGMAGAVIMGTGYQPKAVTALGMTLCRMIASIAGWNYRSRLVDAMAFGSYNRKFGSPAGKEWLSRSEENVAAYVKDPWCSFRFTLNGYYNLFYSIHMLSDEEILDRMPKDLPVLFVSGDQDPVGQFGKGVQKVCDTFRRKGMKDVTCRFYKDDRHEILNEIDREQVYEDIFRWMEYNR